MGPAARRIWTTGLRERTLYATEGPAMPSRKPNAFDRFVAEKMQSPAFAEAYLSERAEIDAIDAVIRAIEAARIETGISKTALARRIAASPESVRRLLTAERVNPTLVTVLRLFAAVGLQLSVAPAPHRKAARDPRRNPVRVAVGA
jgi:DNA-binding phage protein